MNETVDNTVEHNGRLYRYDSDYDCWYRVYQRGDYDDLSHWKKFSWLYVCAVCLVIAIVGTVYQA